MRVRVRVRKAGFPDKTATFDRMGDARTWASRTEADMSLARYHPDGVATRHTVAEMIDRYIDEVGRSQANRERYFSIKRAQLEWWRKDIGPLRLNLLSAYVIADSKGKLLRSGLSPSTVNRYLAAFSHCLSIAAKEWQWLTHNPMQAVGKMKEPRGRVRFLSSEEMPRILNACDAVCPDLYDVAILAISTGARKSELLGLRWVDVDLERGVAVAQETKNGERGRLHITHLALDVLRRRRDQKARRAEYVFPSRTGKLPLNIDRQWRRARAKSGVKDFRFHDMRHCTASYILMSGGSLRDAMEALRHKSAAQTVRYGHLADSHVRDVVERMNQNIFGGISDGEG